jgi:hypothetical protein
MQRLSPPTVEFLKISSPLRNAAIAAGALGIGLPVAALGAMELRERIPVEAENFSSPWKEIGRQRAFVRDRVDKSHRLADAANLWDFFSNGSLLARGATYLTDAPRRDTTFNNLTALYDLNRDQAADYMRQIKATDAIFKGPDGLRRVRPSIFPAIGVE